MRRVFTRRPTRRTLGLLLLAAAIVYLLVAVVLVTFRLASTEKELAGNQRTDRALIKENAATLRRIAADEARLCRAARITKFQPIIAVLCHLPYVAPTPTPTPKASTSAHTVAPSPTVSPEATPSVSPRPSASPTPTASSVCILGICQPPAADPSPSARGSPSASPSVSPRHHHHRRDPDD